MRKLFADIKYFWPSIKPYRWYYVVMFSATLISAFQMPVSYYGIKLTIDILTTKPDFSYRELMFPISIFLFAQLLHEFGWRMSNIAQWKSDPYVRKDIIVRTYDYIQNHSYKFFQDNFVGSLTSKVKDIDIGYKTIKEAIHFGFIQKFIIAVVTAISILLVQPTIGIFIIIWSILTCGITHYFAKILLQISASLMKSRHKLMGLVADRFSNILSLMLFSSRNREKRTVHDNIEATIIPKQVKLYKYAMVANLVQGLLYIIMLIGTLLVLVEHRRLGIISIGDFAFIMGIVFYLIEIIWYMMLGFQDFSALIGDLHSAMDVIQTKHDVKDAANAKSLNIARASISIEFKNIYFSYNTRKVFQGFNLKIKAGEKVAIVGYSGGGKSTLISLLLKYFHLDKGEILINGVPVNSITSDSLRSHIAVIPQDIMLFHNTLMENIRYSRPSATNKEVIEAAKKAHIHEHIITLPKGYQTLAGERGIKISVGQRQRVAIARAILKNAPILILDEATSSLDSKTEKCIQQSIDEILSNDHKTIIAIAHRLSTIKHMDRIIVIADGKIAEEGRHTHLLKKKGIYADLWRHQKI